MLENHKTWKWLQENFERAGEVDEHYNDKERVDCGDDNWLCYERSGTLNILVIISFNPHNESILSPFKWEKKQGMMLKYIFQGCTVTKWKILFSVL